MKITKENYKEIIPKEEQDLLFSLLNVLDDINEYIREDKLYVDWQEYHNEYSCERTDPCPDFYGCYRLKFEKIANECVGDVMTIYELDNVLSVLYDYNYLQQVRSIK